jgi:hypothetical protein
MVSGRVPERFFFARRFCPSQVVKGSAVRSVNGLCRLRDHRLRVLLFPATKNTRRDARKRDHGTRHLLILPPRFRLQGTQWVNDVFGLFAMTGDFSGRPSLKILNRIQAPVLVAVLSDYVATPA